MSVLEERYRRVLGMLPASYRQEWEDEMVATFLASMDTDDRDEAEYRADFGRPGISEVASVAALAVKLRLGGHEAPPRSFLWGEAVRRVALVALLTNAAVITVMALRDLWVGGTIPWPPVPALLREPNYPPALDFWGRALWLCSLTSIGAYLALVFDQRQAARLLAGLALVPPVVRATVSVAESLGDGPPVEYYRLAMVIGSAVCVLALAAFHREAPPVRRGSWLLAFGVAVAVGVLFEAVFLLQAMSRHIVLDWMGAGCLVFIVAALVHLGNVFLGRCAPDSAWSLTLALVAVVALVQRAVSVLDYSLVDHPPGSYDALLAVASVEIALVLVVLVPLAVLTGRSLGRAPAMPVRAS